MKMQQNMMTTQTGFHVRLNKAGDIFAVVAQVSKALTNIGRGDLVSQFQIEATSKPHRYLLKICQKYVHCN